MLEYSCTCTGNSKIPARLRLGTTRPLAGWYNGRSRHPRSLRAVMVDLGSAKHTTLAKGIMGECGALYRAQFDHHGQLLCWLWPRPPSPPPTYAKIDVPEVYPRRSVAESRAERPPNHVRTPGDLGGCAGRYPRVGVFATCCARDNGSRPGPFLVGSHRTGAKPKGGRREGQGRGR